MGAVAIDPNEVCIQYYWYISVCIIHKHVLVQVQQGYASECQQLRYIYKKINFPVSLFHIRTCILSIMRLSEWIVLVLLIVVLSTVDCRSGSYFYLYLYLKMYLWLIVGVDRTCTCSCIYG